MGTKLFQAGSAKADWAAFRSYFCQPYKMDVPLFRKQEKWFDQLHARHGQDGIQLSYKRITRVGAKQHFHAFCLNDQIFFSHDVAVTMLPQPPRFDDPADRSDRLVGIWVHPVRAMDPDMLPIYRRSVTAVNTVDSSFVDHHSPIFKNIGLALKQAGIVQGDDVHFNGRAQLRIARKNPIALDIHRDNVPSNERNGEACWNTFPISAIGIGTTYFVGAQEHIPVISPIGVVSAHVAGILKEKHMKRGLGPLHAATGRPEGRAILTPYKVEQHLSFDRQFSWAVQNAKAPSPRDIDPPRPGAIRVFGTDYKIEA